MASTVVTFWSGPVLYRDEPPTASSAGAMRLPAAAIAGVALGVLAAKVLFVGLVITFVVWGVAALVLGALAPSARAALLTGAVFGFPLTSVFSVFARTGGDSSAVVAGGLGAGTVGAISCLAIAAAGYFGWRRLWRPDRS